MNPSGFMNTAGSMSGDRLRSLSTPAPRFAGPNEHAAAHQRTIPPAKVGSEVEGPLCDNFDGDPDAAIAACGRIIDRGQIKGGYSLVVAYAHRGQAFANKADYEHAITDFSQAIRLKPRVSGYYVMRAAAAERSGRLGRRARGL